MPPEFPGLRGVDLTRPFTVSAGQQGTPLERMQALQQLRRWLVELLPHHLILSRVDVDHGRYELEILPPGHTGVVVGEMVNQILLPGFMQFISDAIQSRRHG